MNTQRFAKITVLYIINVLKVVKELSLTEFTKY